MQKKALTKINNQLNDITNSILLFYRMNTLLPSLLKLIIEKLIE